MTEVEDAAKKLKRENQSLTGEEIAWLDDLATASARVAARRWPDVQSFYDWRSASWEALLRYPGIRKGAMQLETDDDAHRYVVSCVLNECHKIALRDRARRYGGQVSDQAFYTPDMIAAAIPYALSADPTEWAASESNPDIEELIRGGGDPAKGGTRLAVAMDVQAAFTHLGLQDAWVLRRYYIDRQSQIDLAQLLGVARVTVQRYLDRGLASMVAYLGGDRPTRLSGSRKLSSTERYAVRRARSNADSIRELQEVYNG